MRFTSLILALLFAGNLSAQSVTLPTVIKAVPLQWIVVAPLAIDGGKVKLGLTCPRSIKVMRPEAMRFKETLK